MPGDHLSYAALDCLMPMHLLVGPTGHIENAGPTVRKIAIASKPLVGQRLLEFLELHRPGGIETIEGLRRISGQKLHFRVRGRRDIGLKGVVVPIGMDGRILINLSFGIRVVEAVDRFGLTSDDFAATELAVEMLFLVEAKTAVLNELKKLNTRLQGAKQDAELQAQTDTLTGLANRRAMDLTLARLTAQGAAFGLMHLDLDFFKRVNDTLGHAAGDQVLQVVAGILREETRSGDLVARAGGDEFVILFPELTGQDKLHQIARRIINKLEEPIEFEGEFCHISGSIGTTSSLIYEEADPDQMLADADQALYASKHAGRAQVTHYQENASKLGLERSH